MSVVLFGSVFVEAVTHIMLKHVCHGALQPFRRYMCFLLAPALALNICGPWAGAVDETQLLYLLCGVAVTVASMTFTQVTNG